LVTKHSPCRNDRTLVSKRFVYRCELMDVCYWNGPQ
jgi:hypothetical protein